MMATPTTPGAFPRDVLLAHGPDEDASRWMRDVDDILRPSGYSLVRACNGEDAIRLVERGGLAAAVLVADTWAIQGLTLVRIIRSIDVLLPCWLVTDDVRRATLQTALSLGVTGVITNPASSGALALALRRLLVN